MHNSNDRNYLLSLPEVEAAGLRRFERIRQGTVNRNWKVWTDSGLWVVRRNAASMAGADRHAEARVLKRIAQLQISTPLIAVCPDAGYLISQYVDQPVWQATDCADKRLQDRLWQQLAPIHQMELREPATTIHQRLQMYLGLLPPEQRPAFAEPLFRSLEELTRLGYFEQHRICHFDLHHSNIVGYDSICLLDWEFTGEAHPVLDRAAFALYARQSGASVLPADRPLLQQMKHFLRLLFRVWDGIKKTDSGSCFDTNQDI